MTSREVRRGVTRWLVIFAVVYLFTYSAPYVDPKVHSPLAAKAQGLRFRIGADVALSTVQGFGKNHGVTIGLTQAGGASFYNYMTKNPGFFSMITLATNVQINTAEGEFIKGLLSAADADGGRCEIALVLYGVDLGWTGWWEADFDHFMQLVGPNRPCMRFVFLAGEWSYHNRQQPVTVAEMEPDFSKAKGLVQSYGYQLGWTGEAKYFERIPKSSWPTMYAWGPRHRDGQVSWEQDQTKGASNCYGTANAFGYSTDVGLSAFIMWDRAANIPLTAPYYLSYQKFHEFFHGAADRYDASGGAYPQFLTINVMPETFNDTDVRCPYLGWWKGMAQEYNARTSASPAQIRAPTSAVPISIGGGKVSGVKWTTQNENLPPFMAQAGGKFAGSIRAFDGTTNMGLANAQVELYLVKQTLRSGSYTEPVSSVTVAQWQNERKLWGKLTTKTDGRTGFVEFAVPSEPARYALVAVFPTQSGYAASFDIYEHLLVVPKTYLVTIKSNVKVRMTFGPAAYGPPWQGVDSQRWVEPTSSSIVGQCSQADWEFVTDANVYAPNGTLMAFKYWVVEASPAQYLTNPQLVVPVDRPYTCTAIYGPGNGTTPVPPPPPPPPPPDSRIATELSCSASPSALFKGETVIISGRISPLVQRATVTLAYTEPDGSSFTHYVTTSSKGSFSDKYTPDQTGTHHVQASWQGNSSHKGATSSTFFNVTKRCGSILLFVSSGVVNIGDSLGISGRLFPALTGARIEISCKSPARAWDKIAELTTDPDGIFSFTWKDTPASTGTYEMRASWPGNEEYDYVHNRVFFDVVDADMTDFSISVDRPYLFLVTGGAERAISVVIKSNRGFSSAIELSASGEPDQIAVRLYPEALNLPSGGIVSSVLALQAGWGCLAGDYVVHLKASGSGRERVLDVRLTVQPPTPQFAILVNPQVAKLLTLSGFNASVKVDVLSKTNYTIEPSIVVSGLPDGITAKLSSESLVISRLGSGSATLTFVTSSNPPDKGNYTVVLGCSYLGLAAEEKVTVSVMEAMPSTLEAYLSPAFVQYGDLITLNGSIVPGRNKDVLVTIGFRNGTELVTALLRTDDLGAFSYSAPIFLPKGDYVVIVSLNGDDVNLNLAMRVEKIGAIITLSSTAASASAAGQQVLLTGTVTDVKARPIEDASVTVTISDETDTQLVRARTDKEGRYAVLLSSLDPGHHRVTSVVNEGSYYGAARSEEVGLEIPESGMPLISAGNLAPMALVLGAANAGLALAVILQRRRNG